MKGTLSVTVEGGWLNLQLHRPGGADLAVGYKCDDDGLIEVDGVEAMLAGLLRAIKRERDAK